MSEPHSDRVLVGVSEDGRLRVRAASVDHLVAEALERHQPGPLASLILARALAVTAAFPATWKDTERISLQWSGGGPLRSVMTEIRESGSIRGYLGAPKVAIPLVEQRDPSKREPTGHALIPDGFLSIVSQDVRGHFSQSQTSLETGEVDLDLERFFNESDQVPTQLRAVVALGDKPSDARAVAILVQALPDEHEPVLPSMARLEHADPALGARALVDRVLEGRKYDILDDRKLEFSCHCSKEKMASGIALLDVDELLDMINEDNGASVRCDFCAEQYVFTREDLEQIMAWKVTGHGDVGDSLS